jgi:hypothetical protein
MTATQTIYAECPTCSRTFGQPDDPGRKRRYCSDACRQRAYRARGGRASGTRQQSPGARQRQAEQEAWAEQEAARERDRQRKARARGRPAEQIPVPDWTRPEFGTFTDTPDMAKKRAMCFLLYCRANHDGADPTEAAACRDKAEKIRARYGL